MASSVWYVPLLLYHAIFGTGVGLESLDILSEVDSCCGLGKRMNVTSKEHDTDFWVVI